jgi:hypothetical protein
MINKADPAAICSALRPYGTSIFTEMTALSNKMGAAAEAIRRLRTWRGL